MRSGTEARGAVCVVVNRWPRVSTTFVDQELVGLEEQGLQLHLATFGHPDKIRHALSERLRAPVTRLPASPRGTLRFWKAWLKVRTRPGYARAKAMMRADGAWLKKPEKRRKHFARAVILAAEMPRDVGVIYAHFLDFTTTIARYAAEIAELPIAASGHARDIWTTKEMDLRTKLEQVKWCATCTTSGAHRLREVADRPDKIHLVHHGLSFDRFPEDIPARPARDGSDASDPVRLLSVGRMVEKKGFDVLLEALAALPPDLHWHWHHVGAGALTDRLLEQSRELGIAERITWHGMQDQNAVIALYRTSDMFVLPSREGEDGDRDGLPNVLMEAQSQGLACLSTRFSAIPELIVDGETGVLVPPADTEQLAAALERLIRSPEKREQLGRAGYERVRSHFEAGAGIRKIAGLLRQTMR